MNTIKCIITDDEPLARKGLQGYVKKTNSLELIAICENALELAAELKKTPADLLFLDIEMPYMSGIDFLKKIKNPPKIIFTTAFENYALQGFDLDVLDYLLKPISFDRYLKAVNKAIDYFQSKMESKEQAYFFIKTENNLEKVLFDEILFVEAMENYVAIYTAEKKMVTHTTLKSVQQHLPTGQFVQPHKSYIANIKKITTIKGNILHIHKYQVPVSKYQREKMLEKIVNDNLLKK